MREQGTVVENNRQKEAQRIKCWKWLQKGLAWGLQEGRREYP